MTFPCTHLSTESTYADSSSPKAMVTPDNVNKAALQTRVWIYETAPFKPFLDIKRAYPYRGVRDGDNRVSLEPNDPG